MSAKQQLAFLLKQLIGRRSELASDLASGAEPVTPEAIRALADVQGAIRAVRDYAEECERPAPSA